MTPHDVLVKARALIEKPENWARGYLATEGHGVSVDVFSSRAKCFCASGALERAAEGCDALELACDELYYAMDNWIPEFNDTHSHAEVLAAFDRAIEATKEAK